MPELTRSRKPLLSLKSRNASPDNRPEFNKTFADKNRHNHKNTSANKLLDPVFKDLDLTSADSGDLMAFAAKMLAGTNLQKA